MITSKKAARRLIMSHTLSLLITAIPVTDWAVTTTRNSYGVLVVSTTATPGFILPTIQASGTPSASKPVSQANLSPASSATHKNTGKTVGGVVLPSGWTLKALDLFGTDSYRNVGN